MDYDAAVNYAMMNQLCKVCGEPAAGFHFGAFTCEGCKSFFGRTYNNANSIGECKNGGRCVIDKKNRTACKYCRLLKCRRVGMSKNGSRYGRRSNWFKIQYYLGQQQHAIEQQQHVAAAAAAAALLPVMCQNPAIAGASGTIFGRGRDVTNCGGTDSRASSSEPDEEARSGSVLSHLQPSGSPFSDSESASRHAHRTAMPNVNSDNNNNHRGGSVTHLGGLHSVRPVVSSWTHNHMGPQHSSVPIQPWTPLPATTINPKASHKFNRHTSTTVVFDESQEEPIDLSVKSCEATNDELKVESKSGPLDLRLAER